MIKKLILTLSLLLALTNVNAGTGHSHTANKTKIEKNAKAKLKDLISKNKLALSWSKAKLLKIKKQNKEWIVSFENKTLNNKNKLYIYLSSYGKVLGANFKVK